MVDDSHVTRHHDEEEWPQPQGQSSNHLTSTGGVPLPDTDRSLTAGSRGPTVLDDFHLREKITHFDHERIPERVVHARGAGAHGVFQAYGNASRVTRATFLAEAGRRTPVFVRFSTVLGSRGSADTVRDVRGFATKFSTSEGTFDLVGNNIPVFFIQDGIKFPDIIHAAKPHPDVEIPQAQSAHDTFWDFVSLHTEATHMVMWVMSDRAVPRSYRMMEGFGVHTFRLVNVGGETTLAKFHWKPLAGVHSLAWEEAQLAAGVDPDFHRRDLAEAIDAGAYPEWELGLQLMPDNADQTFEGIDLLDPTKIVPEEIAPVQPVGRLTLNRNPSNFFAETEQVAFHTGHLVPGIEVTDDPLMQARLFSYLDTQLTRLGGPNFEQLPINRSRAPVNDMLRDGMHQTIVHEGVAPYSPNTLDGGKPEPADAAEGAYVHVAHPVTGDKVREHAAPAGSPPGTVSFDDHFTQATLFWNSLSATERMHLIEALTFELGKCTRTEIRERTLTRLAAVDGELCERVAIGLGLPAPAAPAGTPNPSAGSSPALAQITDRTWPITGRIVGVVAAQAADTDGIAGLRSALEAHHAVVRVISSAPGVIGEGDARQRVERTPLTTRSVEYDAVVVAAGTSSPPPDARIAVLLQEAFRHGKPIAAWGDGVQLLESAGIDRNGPGVTVARSAGDGLAEKLAAALARHRIWDRRPVPAP
jgi:catalase